MRKTSKLYRKHKGKKKNLTKSKRLRRRRTFKGGFGPGANPIGWAVEPARVETWPGVAGNVSSGGNYIPLSHLATTPGGNVGGTPSDTQSGGGGGKRRRRKHSAISPTFFPRPLTKSQKGGFGLSDLTNVVRGVGASISHLGSTFSGTIPSLSSYPDPVHQGIGNTNMNSTYISKFPDIKAFHRDAGMQVASL
jgi:hypothetical protein